MKYALERWYQEREPVLFPDDIERWNEMLTNPKASEKELKESETNKVPEK